MAMGDFETQKKNLQEKIVSAEEEGQFVPNADELEKLKQELAKLEATKEQYVDVVEHAEENGSENQFKQIAEMGGSEEVLTEKLSEQNEEVKVAEEVVEKVSDGGVEDVVGKELDPGHNEDVKEIEDDQLDKLIKWKSGSEERIIFLQGANVRLLEDNPGPMMMKAVEANQLEIRSLKNTIKKLDSEISDLQKK